MGSCVLLDPNDEEQMGGAVGGGKQNNRRGDSEAGGKYWLVSSIGRALTPSVRNVGHLCLVTVGAAVVQCYSSLVVVKGGQDGL